MSNNKQTAVEWLVEQLGGNGYISTYESIKRDELQSIINQAKEMEKQQKMECWEIAHQAGRFEGKGIAKEKWQTFQQYYNEEYGQQ